MSKKWLRTAFILSFFFVFGCRRFFFLPREPSGHMTRASSQHTADPSAVRYPCEIMLQRTLIAEFIVLDMKICQISLLYNVGIFLNTLVLTGVRSTSGHQSIGSLSQKERKHLCMCERHKKNVCETVRACVCVCESMRGSLLIFVALSARVVF